MERICWATDLHLDLVWDFVEFVSKVKSLEPDGLIITGDVSISGTVVDDLGELESLINVPIWFVLGNHDFYDGVIETTRTSVSKLAAKSQRLRYLSSLGVEILGPTTALVGDDGWADGRFGDFFAIKPDNGKYYQINDYFDIKDLRGLPRAELYKRLKELGDASAQRLQPKLEQALAIRQNVIVATHAPPFEGACWYEGQISDPAYLPHFASKAMGDMLLEVGMAHPNNEILVLCGHTHYSGVYQAGKNLKIRTGGAKYCKPEPCGVISASSMNVIY